MNYNNKIIHGDCLEVMDKMIKEGVKVDAIITDPPYGMNYKSNRRVKRDKFKHLLNDNNTEIISLSFSKINELLKENSSVFIFCSWHKVDKFKIEFEKYWKLKNILVWEKNNHGTGDLMGSYAPKHEFVLFGEKGRHKRAEKSKRRSDVLKYNKVLSSELLHPTEKPINMLEDFMADYTEENEIIIDPFAGSGTTAIAAINTNRKFICIEKDEEYFNIAQERIDRALIDKHIYK